MVWFLMQTTRMLQLKKSSKKWLPNVENLSIWPVIESRTISVIYFLKNAIDNNLPNALKIHYLDDCYYFRIDN